MNDRRAEVLDAYRRHRIVEQQAYYARRADLNDRARRWAVTFSAVLLVFAALFGAFATADPERRALWAFLAATMSALATAMTSYEAAFGFERLARQYADTRTALAVADVLGPQADDLAQLDETARDETVSTFVADTERVLRSEVDTWAHQAATPPERWLTDGSP